MKEKKKRISLISGFAYLMGGILLAFTLALIFNPYPQCNRRSKQDTAHIHVKNLGITLDAFKHDIGRYPSTEEDLQSLVANPGIKEWEGPYIVKTQLPLDPWKRPYHYRSPGTHGEFEIYSYGRDGKPGGKGTDKDITSWE